MKNNSLHEGTARKFAAILLCGLLSLGATVVAAHAPQGGSSYESSQSQRTVKGTVVDEAGDPIVGASVMVQGTSNGVATDISGTFSIYSEVCLLRAEAALAGWTGAGDAQQNYEEGIRASFEDERSFLDDASLSSTANDEAYIAGVALTGDEENKLEQIITQKWLALYPSGMEAWAEFRRTGYPELIPVLHSDDPNINPANGEFIKKIRYIDSERRENAANATSPSLNQGQGDGSTVRVWWDTARYK